ncbi:NnrU family protein [Rubrimonas cliftonensis]|uniref:Uncharacterized membrane protein n=1 Tax=Rubrimonas cliftonensis TaxID=89524 RepID=A0A1H3VT95_9RHOB|nr:NnrU family protein [Rubrimonas cliftonensis]SDZ77980.1 Uncharacterized membrane protein [Rubrimonas cliftonensis]
MAILILGLALFCAVHLIPTARPHTRAALAERFGEGGFKIGYTVVSLIGLLLMIYGYGAAAGGPILWFPPPFLVHVNNLLMLVAVGIFIAGPFGGAVARAIRHPQLIGLKTWAIAHLLVNGDLRSLVLFGGLLAWAVVSVIMINKRDGARVKPEPAARTRDLAHAGAAVVVFLAVTAAHNWLGVWPFPG